MLTIEPFPYQDEAIDMMLDLGYGLIAMEMGLGKTLVSIAIVEELLVKPDINFALIVVPAALKYQWAESIAEFTDVPTRVIKVKGEPITVPTEKYCVVVDGTPDKRQTQYDFIEDNWPNYVIVSYEQVVNDWIRVYGLNAECVILDEASAIKGFKAKRSRKVKRLDPQFAYALTGTPINNRPEDAYSIMEFVLPGFFGSFHVFDTKYIVRYSHGGVKRYRNLDILHKRLSKVMIRKTRRDPDVRKYLPEVDSRDVIIPMDPKVKKLYRAIADEVLKDLKAMKRTEKFDLAAYYNGDGGDMSETGKIMAKVQVLQMLCDHPDLVRKSARDYETTEDKGSKFAWTIVDKGLLDGIKGSPKLDRLVDDVRDVLDAHDENKVIIFSFYKEMLNLIEDALDEYGSVQFTGDMNSAAKAAAKSKFQKDPKCRLFIASDAGGYGVDLPQANYLMNVDLSDSVGTMDQRNARHVRAGSKFKEVFIRNYLMEGSIEIRKQRRLNFKRKVAQAIVDGGRTDADGVLENDVDTLGEFLAA